jgi:acyl-[acyl-carrier-protein]-phospholipid O-acyltransferase/long-chain-fatty-acid--[acyl-carrier-protein] ligase
MGAIPVAPEDGRAAKVEALERAAELLRQGELVCIFAEGSVSRSGSLMPFRRGLERIAKRAGTPIIPVALDGLWGSIFSFEGGRFFWKLPRKLPWPVDVLFGPALPPDTRASEVRAVVEELITTARSDMRGEADTLGGRYLRAARKYAGRTALVDSSGARLTHRRLLVSVLALCRECRRRFSPGERVGVLLPPGAPAVQVTLALTLAGQVPIHLNYSLGAQELSHPIQRAGLQRIVSAPRFLAVLGIEEPPWEVDVLDLEQFAGAISARDKLAAVLASALPGGLLARLWRPAIDPSATATILFSSGSTGAPKGVVLSHANLLSNVIAISQVLALGEEDRILGVLPFFHSFGLTATLWVPLLQGATAVYHNRPTDGARIAKLCETEGVTVALATPTLYQAWMRRAAPEQLGRLRLAIVGAEKLRGALATAFEERYGLPLLEGYGCTELSPVVCMNLPDSDREVPGHERVHRPGTVGRALPGVCLRTVDPKTHAVLEPGAEGLLFVRGPNVMQGYLDDPEATAKVMHGKWYDTGDIGRVDRDSFLVLTDRLSRFAKIGGEMVPQGRVEEALAEVCSRLMEGAAGIEAAMPDFAVCAVPDEKKGERLVVLHTTLGFNPEDWCAGLAKAGLPAIFLPRADQYFEVPEIPRLGTGKLDLGRLKALARELSS